MFKGIVVGILVFIIASEFFAIAVYVDDRLLTDLKIRFYENRKKKQLTDYNKLKWLLSVRHYKGKQKNEGVEAFLCFLASIIGTAIGVTVTAGFRF